MGKPHTIVRQMPDRSKEIYSAEGEFLRLLPRGTRFQKANTDLMGLVPSSHERVETIRRIFRWYVDEGLGQLTMMNRLNEAMLKGTGCASATGKPWGIGSVQQILLNGHYAGNTIFNKRSMGKFFKLTAAEGGIRPEKLPKTLPTMIRSNARSDWIVIKGTHEPLVPPEVFEAAQAKRKTRQTDPALNRRALGSKHLFSGKLRCGECGFHFQAQRKSRRKKNKVYESLGYICGGYKLHGKTTCSEWFLPSHIVEEAVFAVLEKEVATLDRSSAVGQP